MRRLLGDANSYLLPSELKSSASDSLPAALNELGERGRRRAHELTSDSLPPYFHPPSDLLSMASNIYTFENLEVSVPHTIKRIRSREL